MRAPTIAPREWLVVVLGGLSLVFTTWGLAGVQMWSLHTMFAGGVLTLCAAIAPLPRWWNGRDGEHGNSKNLLRLLKFPFFWFSLLFLIYITIQGLNPAWEPTKDSFPWKMKELEPADYITWLPTGAFGEYAHMNAFRALVNHAAAFMLVWGLWAGVRRRQSALILLWAFVVSGVCMALVAILQKYSGTDSVLWMVQSGNLKLWGTFFYRNQGAAYLVLVLIASAVLYFYHFNQAERRGQTGGPYMLLFLFFALVCTSIAMALSRGGILFGGILALCFLTLVLVRWLSSHSLRSSLLVSVLVAVLLGAGAYSVFKYVSLEAIEERFGDIGETIDTADKDSRVIVSKIVWKMAQEELVFGWGAGTWRYMFPMYQKSYPRIYYHGYNWRKGWHGRRYYKHAHNDILQFLCEYGIVGCAFLLLAWGYWGFSLLVRSTGNVSAALILYVGFAVVLGHAFLDFLFQSPAYWVALNGMLCVAVKLLALHDERARY